MKTDDQAGGMFGEEGFKKVRDNPKTAEYFKDPEFARTFQMIGKNPQMLMSLMQTD